ncbi:unnamed protein product, partial [Nesidiocoris tenuis]
MYQEGPASLVTTRLIKRVQMIIKAVNTFKVIHDPHKLQRKAGRKYGLKPKFVKKQVLHSFMFYLAYGHEGREATADEVRDYLISKNQDPEIAKELTTIYSTTSDWKTFVPPVPDHK